MIDRKGNKWVKYPCLDIPTISEDEYRWKNYTKKAVRPMRPYVPGESMAGISVADCDVLEEGGMIARNPKDPTDQWYVAKEFFENNYMEV